MITGVINLLKPPGMTSHDAVAFIRKTYSQKQVGHAGTLDPAAAGVLPIFLGRATRLVEYLSEADKQYRAEIRFGEETDTGDDTGAVIRSTQIIPSCDTVQKALNTFIGEYQQTPPMYSAVKVGGRKLYELARKGMIIERKPRTVNIHAINLISMHGSSGVFDVSCSKGTYIRTLCTDLGERCGSAAVMTFLVRTMVGCFCLQNSLSLEEIALDPFTAILPADSILTEFSPLVLSSSNSKKFLYGQKIPLQAVSNQIFKVYSVDNQFVGIGKAANNLLIPEKVFPLEDENRSEE